MANKFQSFMKENWLGGLIAAIVVFSYKGCFAFGLQITGSMILKIIGAYLVGAFIQSKIK